MSTRRLNPIVWFVLIGLVLTLAIVALLTTTIRSSLSHTCEVCMTFRGRNVCREAVGTTPEEATRTATDNACALLGATGMTLSIECSNTRPRSVTCRGGDD